MHDGADQARGDVGGARRGTSTPGGAADDGGLRRDRRREQRGGQHRARPARTLLARRTAAPPPRGRRRRGRPGGRPARPGRPRARPAPRRRPRPRARRCRPARPAGPRPCRCPGRRPRCPAAPTRSRCRRSACRTLRATSPAAVPSAHVMPTVWNASDSMTSLTTRAGSCSPDVDAAAARTRSTGTSSTDTSGGGGAASRGDAGRSRRQGRPGRSARAAGRSRARRARRRWHGRLAEHLTRIALPRPWRADGPARGGSGQRGDEGLDVLEPRQQPLVARLGERRRRASLSDSCGVSGRPGAVPSATRCRRGVERVDAVLAPGE